MKAKVNFWSNLIVALSMILAPWLPGLRVETAPPLTRPLESVPALRTLPDRTARWFDVAYDWGQDNGVDAPDQARIDDGPGASTAPITILSPAKGSVTGESEVMVTGVLANAATNVTVNGVTAILNGNAFDAAVLLEGGNQLVTVIAEDELGQVEHSSRLVYVDVDGPMIDIHTPKHRQAVYTLRPSVSISYTDFYTGVNLSTLAVSLTAQGGVVTNVTADLTTGETGASGVVGFDLSEDMVYTLSVSLEDALGNVGVAQAVFYVPLDPVSITPPEEPEGAAWVSGVIYDASTCNEHLTECAGLAGARVTIVTAGVPVHEIFLPAILKMSAGAMDTVAQSTSANRTTSVAVVTGPDGFFAYPLADAGLYWVRVEKDAYTYGQREIEAQREHSAATNEIYLTPLDPVVTTCDDGGCSHTNSDGSIRVDIPPGVIPPGQVVTTTATNFEHVEFLPSGDLPGDTWETYAFNLGGDSETSFAQAIIVSVRNDRGFSPGTPVPLGYWNQATLEWEHAGTGVVDADGAWIVMPVTHFSNYDCNDPIAEPDVDAAAEIETREDEPCTACETCCAECGDEYAACERGSFINVKSGRLQEWIDLPPIQALGRAIAPRLRYNSDRAAPSEVIDVRLNIEAAGVEIGDTIGWELYIEGLKSDSFTFEANIDSSGEIGRFRYLWNGRDARGKRLPPGVYEYAVKLSIPFTAQYCYALNGIFGNPPDCVNGATGVFVDAVKDEWVRGTVTLEGEANSPLGAGWVLDGLEQLYEGEDGHILIADGQRNDEFYFPWKSLYSEQQSGDILAWVNPGDGTLQVMPESLAREWPETNIAVGNGPWDIALSPDEAFAYVTNWDDDSVSVVNLDTQQEVFTITVGNGPWGIALSPDGAFAYVTNNFSATVSVVDLDTQQEAATISVGNAPFGIALSPDEAFAYITNWDDATVSVVDLDTQQEVSTIAVGNKPRGIALSPDGTFAYVANADDDTVSVVNLNTRQETDTIAVGNTPWGIALSPDEALVYVSNQYSNSMSVVDLDTQQEVSTITVGIRPRGVALSPDGAFAYITNFGDDTMSVVDLNTRQKVDTIVVGNGAQDVALSSDGTLAYVTNLYDDGVSVVNVDLDARQKVSTISIGTFASYDIALSSDGVLAYVVNFDDDSVLVVDLDTQQEMTSIAVGEMPMNIALSPDGAWAYVTNWNGQSVSVIDLDTQQEMSTIVIRYGAGDIALSLDKLWAYVTNGGSASVSVIDLNTQQEVSTIAVGNGPTDIVLSPDGLWAYVTNWLDRSVSVINLDIQQEVATIALGFRPRDIALSLDGALAYVVDYDGNSVSVLDLNTRQQISTIAVENKPYCIALSPDGAFAYVTNYYSNSVSVIDLAIRQQVAVIEAGDTPIGIATLDNLPLSIYATTATDHSTLTYYTATATYTRTYPSGSQVHFNPTGTHDYSLEPDGRKTVYTYASAPFSTSNPDGSVATMGIIPPGENTPRWVWTFNYNDGQLSSISDPAGRVTSFTIDSQNNLRQVTTPDGAEQRFDYDTAHFLTHHTDQNGAITAYISDGYGRVTSVIEPPRAVYDPLTAQTVITQKVRAFTPSDTGYPLINDSPVGDPDNPAPAVPTSTMLVDRVDYGRGGRSGHTDKWGYWVDETDGISRTTVYERDAAGQVTLKTLPNGDCVAYTYDLWGNVLTRERLAAEQCTVSLTQRRAATAPTQGQLWTYSYEPRFDQVKTATDPLGRTTTYVYDYEDDVGQAGNLIRVEYPLVVDGSLVVTPTVRYTYNAWGLPETETDERGTVTRYTYTQGTPDEASDGATPLFAPGVTPVPGLLTQIVEDHGDVSHLNITTRYEDFDGAGNAQTVLDPRGNPTHYVYDVWGQTLTTEDATGIMNKYEYDGLGNLLERTEDYTPDGVTGRNVSVSYTYDPDGRLLSQRRVDGSTAWEIANTYDVNSKLATETDANGNVTIYGYDDADQLVTSTDPLSQTTVYGYTLKGQLSGVTRPDGSVTRYVHDAYGRRVQETVDQGGLDLGTFYSYDLGGNLSSITDANGKVTYLKYDALDRLVQEIKKVGDVADVVDGDDAVTTYTYDLAGNRLSVMEPNANTSTFGYDAVNRQLNRTNAAGETVISAYDPAGNVIRTVAPNGLVTVNTYDVLNRLEQVDDDEGRVAAYVYDSTGNLLVTSDGNGNSITYAYDGLDRLITMTGAMSETAYYEYDPAGNLVLSTDREGNPTAQAYDALNRLVIITDALDYTTTYGYDIVGNLAVITDANGHATRYDYDPAARLIMETYADGATRSYGYDSVGNLISRIDQNGITTAYVYNDLYFLTGRDYFDGPDDTFSYDRSGRMLTAERDGWPVTFSYDGANRITETVQNGQVIGYAYNVLGNTRTLFYPGGKVITETLDARYRLTQIDDGGVDAVAAYIYDTGDRIVTRTYRNGVAAAYTYNANNWVTSLEHRDGYGSGALLAGFAHGYDREGTKLYALDLYTVTRSEAYDYDNIYRLLDFDVGELEGGAVPTPTTWSDWALDPVGNWDTSSTDAVTETRVHNEVNEIAAIDGITYTFDDNGNLLADGAYTYTYDYENRLTRVISQTGGQVMGEYQYDALGRRVLKIAQGITETHFFHNGARVIEEQDDVGVTEATYVYGTWIDEVLHMERGGEEVYYFQNALGSVVGLTDGSGNVVERYRYTAYGRATVTGENDGPVAENGWGTPHSAYGNPYLFTGRRLDEETGLYYYRTRYFGPHLGRFTTRDIIGYYGGMNLYGYVDNSPLTYLDPVGIDKQRYNFDISLALKVEMKAKWEKYIMRDEEGCCWEIGLNVSWTQLTWLTVDGIVRQYPELPMPPLPQVITVTDMHEPPSREMMDLIDLYIKAIEEIQSGKTFIGWKDFKVDSFYCICAIDCPWWWWDVDFNSIARIINTSSIIRAVGRNYSPNPHRPKSKKPDPNAWNSWSDFTIRQHSVKIK